MKSKDGRIEIELNVGMTTNDNNTVFLWKKIITRSDILQGQALFKNVKQLLLVKQKVHTTNCF